MFGMGVELPKAYCVCPVNLAR